LALGVVLAGFEHGERNAITSLKIMPR